MKNSTILALLVKMQSKLDSFQTKVESFQALAGPKGDKGDTGEPAKAVHGTNGVDGVDGVDGDDGTDGIDGVDGVGISSVTTAADGDIVFTFSDGSEHSVEIDRTGDTYISQSGGGGGMTKAMNPVDNIRSYSFELTAEDGIIILAEDRCRTFFAIGTSTTKDLKVWIGNPPPPSDISKWFDAEGYTFQDGVLGPVYIAEASNQASTVYVMSSVDELSNYSQDVAANVVAVCNLTDELGNLLTDESGNFLVYPQ